MCVVKRRKLRKKNLKTKKINFADKTLSRVGGNKDKIMEGTSLKNIANKLKNKSEEEKK